MISALSRAHAAADHDAWLGYLASPDVAAVTVTVTEAGYLRGADGGWDGDRPEVRADVEALRRDPTAPVSTAPARLATGILPARPAGRERAAQHPLVERLEATGQRSSSPVASGPRRLRRPGGARGDAVDGGGDDRRRARWSTGPSSAGRPFGELVHHPRGDRTVAGGRHTARARAGPASAGVAPRFRRPTGRAGASPRGRVSAQRFDVRAGSAAVTGPTHVGAGDTPHRDGRRPRRPRVRRGIPGHASWSAAACARDKRADHLEPVASSTARVTSV